jgi:SPP1 gp7 family putative phage head morphogenesis protein
VAINANTQIYDKTLDRAAMLRLHERRVVGKVDVIIDGHILRLDKLIKAFEGMNPFKAALDKELHRTYSQINNSVEKDLLSLTTDQLSFAYQKVEVAMGHIWRTERPKVRVAEEIALANPLYKNQTMEQGWQGISKNEKIRIEAVIRKGIADGNTIDEIALAVRTGNVHNITRNQAKGLVITAVTSVTNQADHAIYKANAKALLGWEYVAVLDARTTPLCAGRDGHIYEIGDVVHLPPAHWHCRSTTTPVFKSWDDISKLESVAQIRKRNLAGLTDKQKAFYDGNTPLKESYNDWLLRQPQDVQLRHLGDYKKVGMFNSQQLTLDKFTNDEGNTIGIKELRKMTDSTYVLPNDTQKFANAKAKLDAMQLPIMTPEDLFDNKELVKTLRDYYLLQAGELDGTLSLTNYRGALIHTKKATKSRVLNNLPTEDQTVFNPVTGRYEDTRLYQPNVQVLNNNLRLLRESPTLKQADKDFIENFVGSLDEKMGANERAVVADNLRIIFTRFRNNGEQWNNFKAVVQGQIKFDVMNVSDSLETQLRADIDVLKKLKQDNYIDPILGPTQLQDLHDNFISNIRAKNNWEDSTAPKIARELRNTFDYKIPLKLKLLPNGKPRISEEALTQFYLKFAHRLSLADMPDRDQFAVALGRDLYNLANLNGNRREWYSTGMALLEAKNVKKFFEVETFGVQKRRMKSRLSNSLFGPYYDTLSYNIRVTDPRVQEYAQLTRKVDVGLRVGVTTDKNKLIFREGYKTYFIDRGLLGLEDTRIPITSTNSFGDFPEKFVDKNLADALNWASKSKYKIDEDFYDFTQKLLYFEDDRGNAKKYNELNEYKHYISSRGDAYERFKSMEWLRTRGYSFSNHAFVDHRARIYDRGLISPQSGESFRPFLNTEQSKVLGEAGYRNFRDQIGAFMGGLNDTFEGRYNSLSFTGRQKIADKLWPDMVDIGNKMLRAKPADIRAILESEMVQLVDGEELGKFFRFAMESAKIDNHLKAGGAMEDYKTALALEQDASSSGAQIIALTTKNKQLAELSNVVPTNQKRRLYDEIAAATYNDPRFKVLNEKLGLNEKDLRKAAKAQNMVTFYGAGERTGILNVEGKLSKVLDKQGNTLVVKASDRDKVLNEISARAARYERFDPETAEQLKQLRANVRDIFNKGQDPGDDIMEALYFLDPETRQLVEKMSHQYDRVVTPSDFAAIARLMSEQLSEQVPILKDFTKFFGRLAEDFLVNSKPSEAALDWKSIGRTAALRPYQRGYVLPDRISEILGLKAGEAVTEKFLKRFNGWKPDGSLADIIYGVKGPDDRRTGFKVLKIEPVDKIEISKGIEIFYANKLPKSWTNVPWVNFDGKIIEQNFTQTFEERLSYKDRDGNWVNNILQIPQKTEATWWEQFVNADGKINDIADAGKARTAFAVNGNHSNDATLVKNFHLWGKQNGIATSTIHDAFFANAADMLNARDGIRKLYAKTLDANPVLATLNEMKARGLPKELYDQYLQEAIDKGLIPVEGVSIVGGKRLKKSDILTKEDILSTIPDPTKFENDWGFYGIG